MLSVEEDGARAGPRTMKETPVSWPITFPPLILPKELGLVRNLPRTYPEPIQNLQYSHASWAFLGLPSGCLVCWRNRRQHTFLTPYQMIDHRILTSNPFSYP